MSHRLPLILLSVALLNGSCTSQTHHAIPSVSPATAYRVAETGGRWWLFTPQGGAFYVVGVDHVNYGAHWCESLGYAPYHRNVARAFGSEAAWSTNALARLRAWGFNTLAAGHSASLRHRGLPHIEFISFGTDFAARHAIVPKENWTGFPNVFHADFAAHCDQLARRHCAPQRDDPALLGYFLDNELEWFGKNWSSNLRDAALKLPADDPARVVADKTSTDEFTRLAAEQYFAVTAAAVRRHDPNHLILGCRFAGNAPSNVWAVAGKYCDIVSVNIYPRIDLDRGEVIGVEKMLAEIHARTRRPLMITEWGFPALDAVDTEGRPLPCQHGAGMRVDTQAQKARCCELFQRLMFRLPFVVGSDYFMWGDEPSRGISKAFPEDSNYGLVSETDQPYAALVGMFAALNADAVAIHAGTKPEHGVTPPRAVASAAALAGKIRVERHGERLVVDNGALRLVKDAADGNAWNRVESGGVSLGRFAPNIHQRTPENFWRQPDRVTDIRCTNETGRAVVEMTFECARQYRASYRFTIYPGQNWFLSQLLWIENIADKPWRLVEYYHYATSQPGDTVGGPNVPEYYLPFASWRNKATGKQYGVVGLDSQDFQMTYWLDEHGGQHPDARRAVDRDLAPGTRYAEPQPAIVVFVADADERPSSVIRRVRLLVPQ